MPLHLALHFLHSFADLFHKLFEFKDVVILLAFLDQHIFAVYQMVLTEGSVDVGELFLVDAQAVCLDHLPGLALGREHLGVHSQKVQDRSRELVLRQGELRHPVKHCQEGSLVQVLESFPGCLAEEDA